jgi:hypothetical protein
MTAIPERTHRWRFFRSGGFDQVRIESVADLESLQQLDKKLWASLACPVQGLEFDERTLRYIDADGDSRIRVPEILGAVQWALERLDDKEVLFRGTTLPLKAIHTGNEVGQQLLNSARRILINLGKAEADAVSVDDTSDMARIFPPEQANGDGIVPASFTTDEALKLAIADIIGALGADADRSGEPGVSEEKIRQFFAEAAALLAWDARRQHEAALQPLGADSSAAVAAWQAVAAKIDDFFMRTQFAAYDPRAQTLMNGSEADLTNLAAQALHIANEEALRMPLAQVAADRTLPLGHGINPAWAGAIARLRDLVVIPLLGARTELTLTEWQDISSKLAAFVGWLAEKPAVATASIAIERLAALVQADTQTALLELSARDKAVAAEAESILDVDRLVRYQRYLVPLLNNFVAMKDFYTGSAKAVFQAGTLYLDSRSFDLCVRVGDAGKHATLATLSRTYLAYCDCTRQGSTEKMTVVVAVTAGSAGNLMVGRNGVFYDRLGRDWDATITKLVENPISIREAFWSPYRRIAKMISDQMMKMAASRDQAVTNKTVAGIGDHASKATAAPAPAAAVAAPPAPPFDIGKMVGIFAAIGLALGAIGTALAAVLGSFMSLHWWQMPLAVIGIMLIISGPAMIMAWFKLRGRNLGPILDANGWAVNTEAKINIPFGTALTQLAKLPVGSERALTDPYASKKQTGWWILLIVLIVAGCYFGWKKGAFTVEKPKEAATAPAAASAK